jgi:hypothetical protein
MALTYDDWNEISNRIATLIAQAGTPFILGTVIKNDETSHLVWLEETGSTPIPLVAFEYDAVIDEITYKLKPVTPKVGDLVLVGLHMGSRRLPKCLGRVFGSGYE